MPSTRFSRRTFIRASSFAAGAVLLPGVTRNVLGANERINLAGIGAGGKGAVDVPSCASENIVALCDVDANNAGGVFRQFPNAVKYKDFREMLDKEKSIDACTVSTPDHIHAVAAITAMRRGKHVYVQKPLAHTIPEARLMAKVAKEMKVCTQMGNQGHSNNDTRRLVEVIQGGALGQVKEVHIWTDRAGQIWPQGNVAMSEFKARAGQPAPAHVDFNLWLGPAKERPYNSAYVPFRWRGFWDFGTGALGDMGCHNMDLAFWSLNLVGATSAEAESAENHEESKGDPASAGPAWAIVTINFPKRGNQDACKLMWYEAGKLPPAELAPGKKLGRNGLIFVGTKDTLFVPSYWGPGQFLSGAKIEDYSAIPVTIARHEGNTANDGHMEQMHHNEWLNAIKAGKPAAALSNFDYAGPMTEGVLLGNVAIRAGKKIEWDAAKMVVTNDKDANQFVHGHYRKGWELEGVA
jgi:predicted dehydrogenase